jgi:hypothetical protein
MKAALVALALLFPAWAAHAELPAYVLDKEYQSCAGDGQDEGRNAYCACVRDSMRNWSGQDYADTAQAAAAKSGGATPDKIAEVAKECLAKTLH